MINKTMQTEKTQKSNEFRDTFTKIDHLYHVKEFKSLSQSKRFHLKQQKKLHPSDYYIQMRRLLLHMIYLFYVAHIKKTNFYLYPHVCINRWGVIFRYYSLEESSHKFMDLVRYEDFKENVRTQFVAIWSIKKKEQEEQELKQSDEGQKGNQSPKQKTPWRQFADQFVQIYDQKNIQNFSPKDIISKLQETKHMKNNILMVGVLSSTIFPCIKLNNSVDRVYKQICQEEPYIMGQIFSEKFSNEGTKEFSNSLIRFFKVLIDFKVLGITTTISDKQGPKSEQNESMLTQFRLTLGRNLTQKPNEENVEVMEQKNPVESNKSSEQDYSQGIECSDLGQLKCQYFWSKKMEPMELTFRVSIFINKKIYPLYFREIEDIWFKLSSKWKVILDETKQLSVFNPGFVILGYNKESYQISFTEYVKCQPIQNSLSELIITTDKLIIASLVMREIICFYQKKSISVQIVEEQLPYNDGRLEDVARSICQTIQNYYRFCNQGRTQISKQKMA